jgi:hypothetical protein
MSQQLMERPNIDYTKPVKPIDRQFPPLTAADRCDGRTLVKDFKTGNVEMGPCGAQAFVRVVFQSGHDLIFCGHCAGEQTVGKDVTGTKSARQASNREKFIESGARIISDHYMTINLRPTDPSASNGF